MTKEIEKATREIQEAKTKLHLGALTYEQAQELCTGPLETINRVAAKIAKKHGRRPYAITFTQVIR